MKTAKQIIESSNGRIMRIDFIKRSTGEQRKMLCRIGVKSTLKGGDKAYNESDYGLIMVTDLMALKRGDKKTFRNIPLDGITGARVNGKEYNFQEVL